VSTFVTVGNARQPFARMLRAVVVIADDLPGPLFVQSGATPFHDSRFEIEPFLSIAEFERRVAQSELVITHAGAGSVITAVRAGKVPVVVPRLAVEGEHVDDHQTEFARELARAGRVVAVENVSDILAGVREARARQGKPPEAQRPSSMIGMVADVLRGYADRSRR
jgi:UDP-N-acetylglucosamine transferase subunit ALG13